MRKFLFSMMLTMLSMGAFSQGMTDQQVIDFIARETQAGTSQSQIVTKLMQRGVQIEQIRRLRRQYDSQIKNRSLTSAADGAVSMAAERMQANSDGTTSQEVTTGRVGTTGRAYVDAAEEHVEAETDVKATAGTNDGEGKKVFGRDIFNQRALSFAPSMNIPTPQNYVLGPGDQVVIDIYGASQKTMHYTISPEGDITVPGYGPIHISGLSVAAAQAKIRSTLGSRYSSSNIRTTLGNNRTILINVMGEVKTPGTYHLNSFSTVFHALYMAGGINSLGTLRNIKVYRGGRLITIVDIYEYILNGRLAGNVPLEEGDVIQVGPYDCLVGITGNVKRPMFYEMRKNESVATLVKYAGGFTGDAYKKSIRLTRQAGERYSIFNVDEFEMSSFQLEDGDAIAVDGMINRYENMVEIKGAVFRPGQFRLGGQVSTVRTLIEAAEGMTEDAFQQHAIIHRLKADRSLEIVPIDVEGIMNGSVADVPLQNEDILFIPTQEELRKERNFTVTGEVMTPGTYEYADNTTIEDLIVQAGGLRDGASLARVDVSRRINNPYSTAKTRDIAQTFTFDLKDGLVVGKNRQFFLQPYDVVHVRRSPGYVMPRNITVSGEVNYEGTFTIEKKNLRLTDAIQMAGGVTADAYTKGARLIRHMNEEERQRRHDVLEAIRNTMDSSERDSIAWNKMEMSTDYPIGIRLDEALADPDGDYNIVLREGDRIVVPEFIGTVKVSGDVQFPNTITYVEGKKAKWYINKAGGYSQTAKKRKAFVVYQNGMMELVKRNTTIEPGAEIVVPSSRRLHFWKATEWIGLGSALSSAATTIAMIAYLTKK